MKIHHMKYLISDFKLILAKRLAYLNFQVLENIEQYIIAPRYVVEEFGCEN